MRFEITGTATNIWTSDEIKAALIAAGARRAAKRHAFGYRNQPYVATFSATDQREADKIANTARTMLPRIEQSGSLPALLAHSY